MNPQSYPSKPQTMQGRSWAWGVSWRLINFLSHPDKSEAGKPGTHWDSDTATQDAKRQQSPVNNRCFPGWGWGSAFLSPFTLLCKDRIMHFCLKFYKLFIPSQMLTELYGPLDGFIKGTRTTRSPSRWRGQRWQRHCSQIPTQAAEGTGCNTKDWVTWPFGVAGRPRQSQPVAQSTFSVFMFYSGLTSWQVGGPALCM